MVLSLHTGYRKKLWSEALSRDTYEVQQAIHKVLYMENQKHNMACRITSEMFKKLSRTILVQKLGQKEHPVQIQHKPSPAAQKQTIA